MARLRTAASRTSADQRVVRVEHRPAKEHALAQAGLGRLDSGERPELDDRLERDGGGEDDVPAPELDAGNAAALGHRQAGERVHEITDRLRRDKEPLDADVELAGGTLRRGGEVAYGAADADQTGASGRQPVECAERRAHVGAHAGEILLLGGPVAREEVLGQPHRAQPERLHRERTAVGDARELQAAAAEIDDGAVGQRRRVDRGDIAVERLVARREHLDVDAGLPLGSGEELLLVGGVADRARCHRVDLLSRQPVGATEAGEHGQGLDAAVHRLVAQLPGRLETLADPDRLIQLVGELPPPARAVAEDDESPGVGAEVDDGDLPVLGIQLSGRAR